MELEEDSLQIYKKLSLLPILKDVYGDFQKNEKTKTLLSQLISLIDDYRNNLIDLHQKLVRMTNQKRATNKYLPQIPDTLEHIRGVNENLSSIFEIALQNDFVFETNDVCLFF